MQNLGSHRRSHRHIKHLETTNLFTSKFRNNYGTENFNDELSGSTVERPLGFAACQSKNHDGVTQQIDDRFAAFETDRSTSGRLLLKGRKNALTMLPETEPLRRKAEVAVQVFKDFQFQINDGFEAEARKTVNMVQEWQTPDKYDLAALGIEPWIAKARKQAVKVLNLVAVRVDNESAKVKGELADARKATDEAIRRLYDVLNALAFCILFLTVSRVECCFYHVTEARFKGGVSLLHIKSRPVDG